MRDSNLVLWNAALTATGNSGWLAWGPLPAEGVDLWLIVPQATGTTPTLDPKLEDGDDGTNAVNIIGQLKQITAAGFYRMRVTSPRDYVKLTLTVGGTTPNFGTVWAGLVAGPFKIAGE